MRVKTEEEVTMMRKRGTRRIDEFRFRIENEDIVVPVYLIKGDKYETTTFMVKYDKANIEMTDTNIDTLRKNIEKEIRQWYNIDYKLFISVKVGHEDSRNGQELTFSYEFYIVGKRPDGQTVHKHVPEPDSLNALQATWDGVWNKNYSYGNSSPCLGEPMIGEDPWSKAITTILPATVENVEAILKFDRALRSLAEGIKKWFTPEVIEATIAKISKSSGLLLMEGKK
jgi:hypothetical protein